MDNNEINGTDQRRPVTDETEPLVDPISTVNKDQPLDTKFTPAKLLFYSIVLCLLAYGACAFGESSGLYFLGSLFNFGAAITAIVAIISTFTHYPRKGSWGIKIIITILALAVVGWGGCWGLLGLEGY